MMPDNLLNEIGIYRYFCPGANCEFFFDEREESIAFKFGNVSVQSHLISIRLSSFSNFVESSRQPLNSQELKVIAACLSELVEGRLWRASSVLYGVLVKIAYFLCRLQRLPTDRQYSTQQVFIKSLNIAKLFENLGPSDLFTTWLIIFNNQLNFRQKSTLLQLSIKNLVPDLSQIPLVLTSRQAVSIKEEREIYWWTVIVAFELALDWFKSVGHRDPIARTALYDASITYLQILKDEPRHQSLEAFLVEMGSSLEEEVEKVLAPDDTSSIFLDDEVINRTFTFWFLKRYNWKTARKLKSRSLQSQSSHAFKIPLNTPWIWSYFLAFLLFFVQGSATSALKISLIDRSLSNELFQINLFEIIWSAQIVFQFLTLYFLLKSQLIKFLFSKALFGTLLAWTTVFLTAIPDLQGMGFGKDMLIQNCECASSVKMSIFLFLFFIFTFILSLFLILFFVTQFTNNMISAFGRGFRTWVSLVVCSLFWGMIFTLPINHLLHAQQLSFIFEQSFMPLCFFAITIVGTTVAVFFGLLVQLIWQNESIAEPLGEPV